VAFFGGLVHQDRPGTVNRNKCDPSRTQPSSAFGRARPITIVRPPMTVPQLVKHDLRLCTQYQLRRPLHAVHAVGFKRLSQTTRLRPKP